MDENADAREGRVVGRVPADTFGHRLMLARADAGLTIEQAAAKCGLLSQSWGNWERGRIPRDIVDVVEAVFEGLGIDRDWLLHGGPLTTPERRRRVKAAYPRSRFSRPVPSGPGHSSIRRPMRVDRQRVPA